MESNLIYCFDRQWMFRFGYMAKNTRLSYGYIGHDENSMGERDSSLAKSKWEKNLLIIIFWQRGKIYESTHFLLCEYQLTKLT